MGSMVHLRDQYSSLPGHCHFVAHHLHFSLLCLHLSSLLPLHDVLSFDRAAGSLFLTMQRGTGKSFSEFVSSISSVIFWVWASMAVSWIWMSCSGRKSNHSHDTKQPDPHGAHVVKGIHKESSTWSCEKAWTKSLKFNLKGTLSSLLVKRISLLQAIGLGTTSNLQLWICNVEHGQISGPKGRLQKIFDTSLKRTVIKHAVCSGQLAHV